MHAVMGRRSVLAGMSAAAASTCTSPPRDRSSFSTIAENGLSSARLPGLGVAVGRNGAPLYVAGHGRASLAFDAPATERTLFHAGSLGKAVTAYLVLQHVDRGEIDLDRPIGTYLGDLPATWRAPTIRHYLSHTSGLNDYVEAADFDWDRPMDAARMFELAGEPIAAPGECYFYSGSGYIVLGLLIERLTGRTYDEVVTEMLGRLGMSEARLDAAERVIPDRAEPMEWRDGAWRHATRMEDALSRTADGGLLFSARDMALWLQEMLRPTLVSSRAARLMFEPTPLSSGRAYPYGFAWRADLVGGRRLNFHDGLAPGFSSVALLAREWDAYAFVTTNCYPDPFIQAYDIVAQLLNAAAPSATPLGLAPIPDRAPERTEMALQVMNWTSEADVDLAVLAPELHPHRRNLPRLKPWDVDTAAEAVLLEEFDFCGCTVRRYAVSSTPPRAYPVSIAHAPDGRIAWMY